MNKCTRRGQTLCVWGQIYLILIVCIVCAWLAMIITPSPKQGPSTIQLGGRGTGREVKGEPSQGGGGGGEGAGKEGVQGEGHSETACSSTVEALSVKGRCGRQWERGRGLFDPGGQAVVRLCRVTAHCRSVGAPAPDVRASGLGTGVYGCAPPPLSDSPSPPSLYFWATVVT